MVEVIWDDQFIKIFKKWSKKHPDLLDEFRYKLEIFCTDPFDSRLKSHALHGELKGLYAARISFQYRLVFSFLDNSYTQVVLVDIGTHEEVY